jgi:cobalamin biosynthesis protein CobT
MLTPIVLFQQAPAKSLDIVRDKAEIIDLCQRNLLNEDQLLALTVDAQSRILMLVEMLRSAAEPPRRVASPSNESATPGGTKDTGTPADTIEVLGGPQRKPDDQDAESALNSQGASGTSNADHERSTDDRSTTLQEQDTGNSASHSGPMAKVEATDAGQSQNQEQGSPTRVCIALDKQ